MKETAVIPWSLRETCWIWSDPPTCVGGSICFPEERSDEEFNNYSAIAADFP